MPVLLHPGRSRGLVLLLIACALAMRVLVPSGFMLMPAGGALPTLVICPDQGPIAPALAMRHHAMPGMAAGHHAPHPDKSTEHPCAFAAASAAVDLAAILHPMPPVAPPRIIAAAVTALSRPGLGLAAPPPPKTGPPLPA